jgi:hypothetical protein
MQSALDALKKKPLQGRKIGWWVVRIMITLPLHTMIANKQENRDSFVVDCPRTGSYYFEHRPFSGFMRERQYLLPLLGGKAGSSDPFVLDFHLYSYNFCYKLQLFRFFEKHMRRR